MPVEPREPFHSDSDPVSVGGRGIILRLSIIVLTAVGLLLILRHVWF